MDLTTLLSIPLLESHPPQAHGFVVVEGVDEIDVVDPVPGEPVVVP